MKHVALVLALCILGSGLVTLAVRAPNSESAAQVERGKYLVEAIGKCDDCHTPMDEKGEPLPGKLLKGAVLSFKPTVPIPVWADASSKVAGLPPWEKDDAVKFFMTGIKHNGLPARRPMPRYEMNKQDAEAVVAYLKSLAPTDN